MDRSGRLEANSWEKSVQEEARALKRKGMSLNRIGLALADRGLLSRTGKPFAPAQVARMVKDEQ